MYDIRAHAERRAPARFLAVALAVLALLAWVGAARAGSDERKGTGGALELRIPVGARGNALGGTITGDASGIEAAFWNPAGLATIERTEVLFDNMQYFADMDLNYLALATHLGGAGTLGFQLKVLSIGDLIVTTESAPEGTGEIIRPTFTVMGATWGREFTDRVRFGASLNWVSERVQDVAANGVAADFGVQYLTGWHNLQFGVVMKNFGTTMEFTGAGFETSLVPPDSDPNATNRVFRSTSAAFELPSYFALSTSFDVRRTTQHSLRGMASFQNNNFSGDNLSMGLEWDYRHLFALRGSYVGTIVNEVDPDTGDESISFESGDDLYGGLAMGAGLNLRVGGTTLGVDVSWRQVDKYFDDILETALRLRF